MRRDILPPFYIEYSTRSSFSHLNSSKTQISRSCRWQRSKITWNSSKLVISNSSVSEVPTACAPIAKDYPWPGKWNRILSANGYKFENSTPKSHRQHSDDLILHYLMGKNAHDDVWNLIHRWVRYTTAPWKDVIEWSHHQLTEIPSYSFRSRRGEVLLLRTQNLKPYWRRGSEDFLIHFSLPHLGFHPKLEKVTSFQTIFTALQSSSSSNRSSFQCLSHPARTVYTVPQCLQHRNNSLLCSPPWQNTPSGSQFTALRLCAFPPKSHPQLCSAVSAADCHSSPTLSRLKPTSFPILLWDTSAILRVRLRFPLKVRFSDLSCAPVPAQPRSFKVTAGFITAAIATRHVNCTWVSSVAVATSLDENKHRPILWTDRSCRVSSSELLYLKNYSSRINLEFSC